MKRQITLYIIVIFGLLISLLIILPACAIKSENKNSGNREETETVQPIEEQLNESDRNVMVSNRAILYAICDKEMLSNRIAHYCYEYFKSDSDSSWKISDVELINKTWLDELWKKHKSNYILMTMENSEEYCFIFEGNEVWAIMKGDPEGDIIMIIQE